MKFHLVTYSDGQFKEQQDFINIIHGGVGVAVHAYDRDWLEGTNFYKNNYKLFDDERGAGCWIWKPYVILDTIEQVDEGDVVVYCDCGDMFSPGLIPYLEQNIGKDDLSLLLLGGHPNRQ